MGQGLFPQGTSLSSYSLHSPVALLLSFISNSASKRLIMIHQETTFLVVLQALDSVPQYRGEGFLQRKLVSTREERRTITYLSVRKLGQSGTHCLPKPFHFTGIARMCHSNYSVLLQSQQGSGTQSSCNFTAPESLSTCNLSRLCWICKFARNCKFSTVSEVSCLVWDSYDCFPLASPSFCWTQGGDPSLESSEPVHPWGAQSACK